MCHCVYEFCTNKATNEGVIMTYDKEKGKRVIQRLTHTMHNVYNHHTDHIPLGESSVDFHEREVIYIWLSTTNYA